MDLSPRISELLYHYDCVIVPELGGFVTEYRSARIDKLLHVIHPPAKDLRFNAQLKKNDGLLANAISRAENISHEAANQKIKNAVEGYFSELEEGRPVNFEKVGILYLDSHKNIQFSPDTSVNYLLESFRLKKIYARPVKQVAPIIEEEPLIEEVEELVPLETAPVIELKEEPAVQEKEESEEIPVIPIQREHTASSRKYWAAAALIPILLYVGWVGVRSDVLQDGTIQMSDLNPFVKKTQTLYQAREEVMPPVDFSENEIPAETRVTDPIAVTTEPEKPSEEETKPLVKEPTLEAEAISTYVAPKAIGTLEYHVIGGCFSEEGNAQKLVDRLRSKGYEAFIIDTHKGLHRVAYGSYADRQGALDLLARVKEEEMESAWLLRKK